ncbi:MAG TPA: glycosyltransferase family 39 protein [Chloroflexota bacterium]
MEEGRFQHPEGRPSGAERWALPVLLALSFISHAYNLFQYPPYLGDEGIYMEQAWAVLRQGKLSPYTYFYDHAPAGWLLIAWWTLLLPAKFSTFGMAINAGRVLMLVLHVASSAMLFSVARRWGGTTAAAIAVLVFSLSPLSIYYQRMVLLDNIAVFWVMASLYLILFDRKRLWTVAGSAATLGLAVLSKENSLFFAPVLGYLLYRQVRDTYRFRFAMLGWVFTLGVVVSLYPLLALLKTELLPSDVARWLGMSERVSLIDTLRWQLTRPSNGSLLNPYSDFWWFFWNKWWIKDPLILALGGAATLANLLLGRRPGQRQRFVAALLAIAYGVYLGRGSVILEFYVVPILPFLALNAGLLVGYALQRLPEGLYRPALVAVLLGLTGSFLMGARDHYTLDLVDLQEQQLAFVRENVPSSAVVIIDDDLWVDLREGGEGVAAYPNAHSHWKAVGDPEVRDRLLQRDWRRIDYLVLSDDLAREWERQAGFGVPNVDMLVEAHRHSEPMARFVKGAVELQVRRVNK